MSDSYPYIRPTFSKEGLDITLSTPFKEYYLSEWCNDQLSTKVMNLLSNASRNYQEMSLAEKSVLLKLSRIQGFGEKCFDELNMLKQFLRQQ